MSMTGTEQSICNDILGGLIQVSATTVHLGKGVPTTASTPTATVSGQGADSVVLTYKDGSKYRVTVKVEQLNQNAGRV